MLAFAPAMERGRRWNSPFLAEADRQLGGDRGWLIINDPVLPHKGRHSVGVATQHASAGKNAICQAPVSMTLALREVPVMVALRRAWIGRAHQ